MSSPLLDITHALSAFADTSRPFASDAEVCPVPVADRRAHARLRPIDLPRPVIARFKHGPVVRLLDVSTGGALLETATRLSPGGRVVLEFIAPGGKRTMTIASRVMRSQVSALGGSLRYRSGVAFKQPLALAEFDLADEGPSAAFAPVPPGHDEALPAAAHADAAASVLSVIPLLKRLFS